MSSANSICTALLRMDTPPFSHVQTHPSTVLPYLKKTERGHSIYLALSSYSSNKLKRVATFYKVT